MQTAERKIRLVGGGLAIASGCAVACVAAGGALWMWAPAFAVTWSGAYLVVRSRGCTPPADQNCGPRREPLDPAACNSRLRSGATIGAATLVAGALAYRGVGELWPLVSVAAWFSLSFLVAGVTGYPGCPETGAVLSVFRRSRVSTACPPLEKK